jgi:hypothetical protein
MKNIIKILFLIAVLGCANNCAAQKRPPKQDNVVTPADGAKKSAENKNRKWEEYETKKNHHNEIQDKATKKRMKESLKKSKSHGSPNRIPWYKKLFW